MSENMGDLQLQKNIQVQTFEEKVEEKFETGFKQEEKTTEAALDGTLFEKISGKDFYPGMLIRETK